jgi:hypothetical protein
MTPSRYCCSTSIWSVRALSTTVAFSGGTTMSSTPIEMPARVA